MSNCFRCKKQANIKINILKYCNNCFLDNFESKLQKNIPKMHSNPSVFVYFNDSSSSIILKEAVERMLKIKISRKQEFSKIAFYSQNKEIYLDPSLLINCSSDKCDFSLENDFNIRRTDSDVIKYCLDNFFDILIFGNTLDQTVTNSLQLLCSGKGLDAVESCSKNEYRNDAGLSLTVANLLNDVKDKEIAYYLFLKKINRIKTDKSKNVKIRDVFNDFVGEIDDKNELAIYNVQNTFEKLYKLFN